MALPNEVRERWNLVEGGSVEVADLGSSLLIVPAGSNSLGATLGRAVEAAGGYPELVRTVVADERELA